MRLYRLIIQNRVRYAGTQADARAMKRETGAAWTEVEVPTDKGGLIAFLNENAPITSAPASSPPPTLTAPAAQSTTSTLRAPLSLDAASVLARMDNPDGRVDAVVEAIAAMKGGYALKRVAGAVAVRFEELAR